MKKAEPNARQSQDLEGTSAPIQASDNLQVPASSDVQKLSTVSTESVKEPQGAAQESLLNRYLSRRR